LDVDDRVAEGSHQVVAGILVRQGEVLLCHRSAERSWFPDVWDFPGGHVEDGESPRQALVRELHEELGVHIALPPEAAFARLQTGEYDCLFWVVEEWTGTPSNADGDEHDEMAWWPASAVDRLRLAHEDYPALIRRALTSLLQRAPLQRAARSARAQLPGLVDPP
jgi:mutator protein MutT